MPDTPHNNGPSILPVLFLIFLVLKLCDVIDWSWWWVASPLWIPFAALIAIILLSVFKDFLSGQN